MAGKNRQSGRNGFLGGLRQKMIAGSLQSGSWRGPIHNRQKIDDLVQGRMFNESQLDPGALRKKYRGRGGFFTNVYVGETYRIFREAHSLKEVRGGRGSDWLLQPGK